MSHADPHANHSPDTANQARLTRRTAVAGAGAVWTAPAITVVASAPAFATSGQVQVTALLPDATRPVSAYQRGTTQTFTATLTRGTTTTPVAAGTAVVFTLDRLPGDTTSATDWLSLHPTNAATTTTTTTDASGQATITVRYLPGVVPALPTSLRLTATTSTGSATLATWNLTYRPARPGSTDPHGAYAVVSSCDATHSLALRNGHGYAFGEGSNGRLGNGTTTASSVPSTIATTSSLADKTITALAAGLEHGLALASDGTLHAWGRNSFGQLGDGTTTDRTTAVAVTTAGTSLEGKTIIAIAAGNIHSLALASDGTLHAWGRNGSGQLGDGSTTVQRTTAVAVTTDGTSLDGKTIVAIAAGSIHNLALASDGTLHAWGGNGNGRLGDGTTTNRTTAVTVTSTDTSLNGKTITAIAAGNGHSLALASDGTLHAWGNNNNGQLGDSTTALRTTAVAVTTAGTSLAGKTITAIAAGFEHSLALASDGTVHAWGDNTNGQLGEGTTTDRATAVAVTTAGTSLGGRTITALAAGNNHSLALASDGALHGWGRNLSGQLGDGTTTNRSTAGLVDPLPA